MQVGKFAQSVRQHEQRHAREETSRYPQAGQHLHNAGVFIDFFGNKDVARPTVGIKQLPLLQADRAEPHLRDNATALAGRQTTPKGG